MEIGWSPTRRFSLQMHGAVVLELQSKLDLGALADERLAAGLHQSQVGLHVTVVERWVLGQMLELRIVVDLLPGRWVGGGNCHGGCF